MRNVSYKSLWGRFILIWVCALLFFFGVHVPAYLLTLKGLGMCMLIVACASGGCMLQMRLYRDQVAETRLRNQQCVECGYSLYDSPERCPECGKQV